MAFKMVDKASAETGITISSARETFGDAVQEQRALAAPVSERQRESCRGRGSCRSSSSSSSGP